MKKSILLLLVIAIIPAARAQTIGGTFSPRFEILNGLCHIYLKDGSMVEFDGVIRGDKFEGTSTDIVAADVDYIELISTKIRKNDKMNGSKYRYVSISDEPTLVRIIIETPKLSFYEARPQMTGGGMNGGVRSPDGIKYNYYVLKEGEDNATAYNAGKNQKNLKKIFPECPRLAQYQKDKKFRALLIYFKAIAYVYNGPWEEATPEEMEADYLYITGGYK